GTHEVLVEAEGGGEKATAKFDVRVRRLPASLAVAAPPEVQVRPAGENHLTIRVLRERFAGPITLRFAGDKEGLTFGAVPLPAADDKLVAPLTADRTAKAGQREIELTAVGSDASAGTKFRVVVLEPPPPPPTTAPVTPSAGWSWLELARTAGWTALLAVGLALALVMGQNYFLGKRLFGATEAKI